MIVRKLRLQRGWSQEQLAQISGLSVRTIQRIERGQNAGLESLKSLASVFDVELSQLQQEKTMATTEIDQDSLKAEEQKALAYVRDLKGFYTHLTIYLMVVCAVVLGSGFKFVGHLVGMLPWGVGVLIHGLCVFEVFHVFDAKWERKQIEKRLGRKL